MAEKYKPDKIKIALLIIAELKSKVESLERIWANFDSSNEKVSIEDTSDIAEELSEDAMLLYRSI